MLSLWKSRRWAEWRPWQRGLLWRLCWHPQQNKQIGRPLAPHLDTAPLVSQALLLLRLKLTGSEHSILVLTEVGDQYLRRAAGLTLVAKPDESARVPER